MRTVEQAISLYRERSGAERLKLKAALIDMDGTLYDSMPRHSMAWERLCEDEGWETTPGEFFLHEGQRGEDIIDYLMVRSEGRHATDEERMEMYHRKTVYFSELPEVGPVVGAPRMTRLLADNNVKCVLVTGSGQDSLLNRLDADFPGIFPAERRVTSRNVKRGKPHPEPFLRAMLKAGALPTQSIVVENAPLGVTAGYRSGAFTVAVATGPIPIETLYDAGADIVFESMDEFADALPTFFKVFNLSRRIR